MKVFITGASSGLGAALARRYAAQGATLGLVARRAELLEQLAASLPGQHFTYALDVNHHDALRNAAQAFIDSAGVPDIVIANAGISVGTLTEYRADVAVFERIINTNLVAMVATFSPFIAPMRATCTKEPRTKPRLVGIASVAGVRGLPGSEAYCASKAAVICYCESLRLELRDSGIRVVTLMPGFVDTPLTASNPYPMPFIIDADTFSKRAVAAIDRGVSCKVIPWQMAVVAVGLRALPNWLYDFLFAHAKRKPRAH